MEQKKSIKLKVKKSNRFVYVRQQPSLTATDPTIVITTTLTAFGN